MALYHVILWYYVLLTASVKVDLKYSLNKYPRGYQLHSHRLRLVMESWKGCWLWCVVVGAEISLLSNLIQKLPRFSDAWNAPSLLWGRLVMLSGRHSRTAPESGLSPRWWRYGNRLSNDWITTAVDKDAHQAQMLLAFPPPIRIQEPGDCRRRRRPAANGGTTPSLSDTGQRPQGNNRGKKKRGKKEKETESKRKSNFCDACPWLLIN